MAVLEGRNYLVEIVAKEGGLGGPESAGHWLHHVRQVGAPSGPKWREGRMKERSTSGRWEGSSYSNVKSGGWSRPNTPKRKAT